VRLAYLVTGCFQRVDVCKLFASDKVPQIRACMQVCGSSHLNCEGYKPLYAEKNEQSSTSKQARSIYLVPCVCADHAMHPAPPSVVELLRLLLLPQLLLQQRMRVAIQHARGQ
jgi:hypothetical protein